jgi:hypothetical protein
MEPAHDAVVVLRWLDPARATDVMRLVRAGLSEA